MRVIGHNTGKARLRWYRDVAVFMAIIAFIMLVGVTTLRLQIPWFWFPIPWLLAVLYRHHKRKKTNVDAA